MIVIIFEYLNKKSESYEQDQFECMKEYQEFKNFIVDNDILSYEVLDIIVE